MSYFKIRSYYIYKVTFQNIIIRFLDSPHLLFLRIFHIGDRLKPNARLNTYLNAPQIEAYIS